MRRLNQILVVLVVVAAGALGWLVSRPEPEELRPEVRDDGSYQVGSLPDGQEAVRTAADTIEVALTYDYRSLDEGLDRATERMTEPFAGEFRTTFRQTAATMAVEKKGITQALVRGAGLVELHGDRATCLVYVDQLLVASTATAEQKAPVQITRNRVLVELERSGDAWAVSGIAPF